MQGVTITLEELLALRYVANRLHLPQQRRAVSDKQGGYLSPFRGRGMDFMETQIYQPGDDVRRMHWAVTAKTGKPHTKIYQQERDLSVLIVIDFKPSMFFGTKKAFKSVIAAHAGAIIAWAALKRGDRIGCLLLKDKYYLLPPRPHRSNIIEFFKQLVTFVIPQCNTPIDYQLAFMQLRKIAKSGGQLYFISDFYSYDKDLEKELVQFSRHHEVTNILVYDELEKTPPKKGHYLFHNSFTPGNLNISGKSNQDSLLIDTYNHEFCEKYTDLFEQRLNMIKKLCYANGMRFDVLSDYSVWQ